MSQSDDSSVILSVRGSLVPKSLEAARKLHNETAGSAQGIAAARALGDLSHKVYSPVKGAPGSTDGELLFLDVWQTAEGIGKFFQNPHVQDQAATLFSARDWAIWMRAKNAFSFDLPAPVGRNERFIGVVRGLVKSPEQAITTFKTALQPRLGDARRMGQISHEIFFRLPVMGESLPPEMFGIDVWYDAEGMKEYYRDLKGLEGAFAGPPAMSVWEEPNGGGFTEW